VLLNPSKYSLQHEDQEFQDIILKTIQFFETKGLQKVRDDDTHRVWYADFLEFVKKEKIFAKLLTPPAYGKTGYRWDTWRIAHFNEILGFYGLAYWYTWQVSILGLGPIWMSTNEALKQRAASLLEAGEVFAFGLSEKDHGADIYSTEMSLTPQKNIWPMDPNIISAMATRQKWSPLLVKCLTRETMLSLWPTMSTKNMTV
jgi:acyl-CoA dehydrogenase